MARVALGVVASLFFPESVRAVLHTVRSEPARGPENQVPLAAGVVIPEFPGRTHIKPKNYREAKVGYLHDVDKVLDNVPADLVEIRARLAEVRDEQKKTKRRLMALGKIRDKTKDRDEREDVWEEMLELEKTVKTLGEEGHFLTEAEVSKEMIQHANHAKALHEQGELHKWRLHDQRVEEELRMAKAKAIEVKEMEARAAEWEAERQRVHEENQEAIREWQANQEEVAKEREKKAKWVSMRKELAVKEQQLKADVYKARVQRARAERRASDAEDRFRREIKRRQKAEDWSTKLGFVPSNYKGDSV